MFSYYMERYMVEGGVRDEDTFLCAGVCDKYYNDAQTISECLHSVRARPRRLCACGVKFPQ